MQPLPAVSHSAAVLSSPGTARLPVPRPRHKHHSIAHESTSPCPFLTPSHRVHGREQRPDIAFLAMIFRPCRQLYIVLLLCRIQVFLVFRCSFFSILHPPPPRPPFPSARKNTRNEIFTVVSRNSVKSTIHHLCVPREPPLSLFDQYIRGKK